jgi:hypothetical protein
MLCRRVLDGLSRVRGRQRRDQRTARKHQASKGHQFRFHAHSFLHSTQRACINWNTKNPALISQYVQKPIPMTTNARKK